MAADLLSLFVDELGKLFEPVIDVVENPLLMPRLLAQIGVESDTAGGDTLAAALSNIATLANDARQLAANPSPSFDDITGVLAAVGKAFDALRALSHAGGPMQQIESFGTDLSDFLVASYLMRAHPLARQIAALLTLVELEETLDPQPPVVVGDKVVRGAYRVDRFHLERISGLLKDPVGTLRTAYLTPLLTVADANAMAGKLFPRIRGILHELGVPCRYGFRPGDERLLGDAAPLVDHALIVWAADKLMGATEEAGAVFTLSPAERGDLGLLASPFGALQLQTQAGPWAIELDVTAAVEGVAYGRHGVTLLASPSLTQVDAKFTATLAAHDKGSAFILGAPNASRIEVGGFIISAQTALSAARKSLVLSAAVSKAAIVILPGDGDGFLASLLPAEGLRTEFDLGLGWSSDAGLTLKGQAGLDATLSVGRSLAGVTLSTLHVGLQARDSSVNAEVTASLSAAIGPVRAMLDGVGLAATLGFPSQGGNLGVADLALGFKGPKGIGLTVDAKGVLSGSGFLYHDQARSLYAGALQLSLQNRLTLKAFGLIATGMPDGSSGYSLIVFITAEDFRPIPLGFGFNLLGIGGMVAIHRTFDVDVLREGLKNDTLASLLFPRDPVGNAPALINALATAFPARKGSYLLGLVVKIGWFTPTLVLLDLALIMEFGNRSRLLALGRVSAMLPSRDNDLVRLNLDALGVIDFDAKTAAVDAVLVDSRLVHKFAITGAGALRAGFGGGPDSTFVLAVGGLNPHFAGPSNFPRLARVTIALASGKNPRLTCEAYFAITANTLQFGARASLYASAGGFSVEGDVGYDVLVQWVPLHFLAEFDARVQLKRGSTCLFMLQVKGELEGPRPLRLSGKATFKIFFCHFSVRFDTTLVNGEPPPLPPAVDVRGELIKALLTPQSWTTQNANNAAHGVALRSLPNTSTALVLDPLGRLTIKQQVVPLNTQCDIETFGGAPVMGDRRFNVGAVLGTDTAELPKSALSSSFARSQFFHMNEDERLTAPSFETYEAGCVFGSGGVKIDEKAEARIAASLGYDTFVIDVDAGTSAPPPATAPAYMLTADRLTQFARSGAAGRAPVRSVAQARFANTGSTPPAMQPAPSWTIVPKSSGASASVAPATRTWSEYQAALKTLNRGKATWQLLPTYEVQS